MNIMILGAGGREHALTWKISQSDDVDNIFVLPGNYGISKEKKVTIVNSKNYQNKDYLNFAIQNNVELVVVGPEEPLVNGIVDIFEEYGIKIFGPNKNSAMLEGSKEFCKDFFSNNNIPTAHYKTFNSTVGLKEHIDSQVMPIVIKVDNLAAGKGVFIVEEKDECLKIAKNLLSTGYNGIAAEKIIIEDFLKGEEASFMCIVAKNKQIIPLTSSKDHKKLLDGDLGLNTGGMGAYSPTNLIDDKMEKKVIDNIIKPTVDGLAKMGIEYTGFLYAGLMIDKEGNPFVLEYNCRLGDPEAQSILMRLDCDLFKLLNKSLDVNSQKIKIIWKKSHACTVVLASDGYPLKYKKNIVINDTGTDNNNTKIFHSGTVFDGTNTVTNGGRVLSITALGNDLEESVRNAYARVGEINWDGMVYRKDIAKKEIEKKFIFS